MIGHGVVHALFRCDGAAVPSAWNTSSWEIDRPILTRGKDQDLDLKVESLAAKVVGLIDARAADLVRIAGYAYAADQMLARGGPVDVHRRGWRRRLALCVPVSDPAFWTEPAQGGALREALGFLTDDEWDFAFDRAAPEVSQLPLDLPALPTVESPDAIVLLSGGTDSLCALVAHVAAGGRPLVVSHRSAPQLDRWQRDLLQAVRAKFPSWRFPQLSFWVQRRHGDAANSAQRSRAFLFAALGAAVAGQIGIRSVLLPDNGYVSLNPPISGQLMGALASRSTHPKFLRLFNRLVDGAFLNTVQVRNPLADVTRAEALGVLEPNGCAELLAGTHSCGNHRGRTNAVPHCGGCSQCVDRRFSSVAAGLEAYDPAGRYGLDVFVDPLPEGEPRTIAESYVRFARTTNRATDDDLLADLPQLIDALDPDDPGFGEAGLRLLDLLRRHANEVVGVIGEMIARYSAPLARSELSPDSLLPIVLRPDGRSPLHDLGDQEAHLIQSNTGEHRTENIIAREHGVWHVTFRGRKGTYPRSRGMERLARLLAAPGQGISSLDLKMGPTANPEFDGSVSAAAEEGCRPTDPGALGEIIDEPYEQGMKARAKELGEAIARARDDGNDEVVETLLSELRWIKVELQGAIGLRGRRRSFSDEHEAARKTVQKTVASAIESFAETLPELHEHLDRWVELGLTCVYDPVPKERWRVTM
jgi:7-cyano-7-deazaguanine synthase in queuosine biosynthesis